MSDPIKETTKEQAIKELWKKGELSWKLNAPQKEIYTLYKNSSERIITILMSRRFGKTRTLTVIAIEECLKNPNAIVKFLCPTQKMIKGIINPIIRSILIDCPKTIRPKFLTNESKYRFPNGSEIQLAGSDNGRVENIRGSEAHLCIIDEAGFCDDLHYSVTSVLLPTVSTTGGKILLSSTPPKSPGHEFGDFVKQAIEKGTLIKKTIFDNIRFSPAQINEIISQYPGGIKNNEFKREYLAEMVIDEKNAVIPEFTAEVESKVVLSCERPKYFDYYLSMDIGMRDWTAVLFGYYDFLKNKFVIEDELVMSKEITPNFNTETLVNAIKLKEDRLLMMDSVGEKKEPFRRIADNNNLFLLEDLNTKYGLYFKATDKDDLDAAVNNVRVLIQNEKILINPKCVNLIKHLKSATWNKSGKKQMSQSSDGSHYDTVAALIYLMRNVLWTKNPYPKNYDNLGNPNWYVYRENNQHNPIVNQIKSWFKVKKS